jgi:hypothetical protein
MHCLKPGSEVTGEHTSLTSAQACSNGAAMQARTNLMPIGGGPLGGSMGKQPPCFSVSGAIVTDCAHGTPPQSLPAGIPSAAVQVPSQLSGGSKDVWATPGPSAAQLAAAAVNVAGNAHSPIGAAHVQASHWIMPLGYP